MEHASFDVIVIGSGAAGSHISGRARAVGLRGFEGWPLQIHLHRLQRRRGGKLPIDGVTSEISLSIDGEEEFMKDGIINFPPFNTWSEKLWNGSALR